MIDSKGDGYSVIRNGLKNHIAEGRINPTELGVYIFLQMNCDFSTGVYRDSAMGIAFKFNNVRLTPIIQESLLSLRKKKFINYRRGDGTPGGYPIIIDKYEPTSGRYVGWRLDAWKHGSKAIPEYVEIDQGQTEARQMADGRLTDDREEADTRLTGGWPLKDMKGQEDSKDVKDMKSPCTELLNFEDEEDDLS